MTLFTDDDARWAAMQRKDAAAEGQFIAAVRTTGVYCRPSCSARPLRKNVAFYDSIEAARAAGFRACKRCRPDEPRETLRYATTATDLGLVLAAVSDKGLCALTLGDDPDVLAADLARRFPKARRIEDAAGLADALAEAKAAIAGRGGELELDERGTDLQRRVWQALRAIPAGRTVSYAEVARRIGRPAAVRAVAQACGANPLAVVTPCHRVVRSDGGLSGYRWGVERKAALLAREARA
jgi:AraC family transcriptional regulator, regulatory protein of adaptative response / methylated-DNA-[protein]-cysteine methyltransferase